MSLRDHAHAKAPYLLAGGGKTMEGEEKASEEQLKDVPAAALAEAERPLIGTAEENGVIDPDVLWSCTTCGACVEQCPVDIEHIDHIVDMRRYQVMIESAFPSEAGTMLKNLEKKGNPWGLAKKQRLEWLKEVDFEVPVVGKDIEDLTEVEYLYWVGCAGAWRTAPRRPPRPSRSCCTWRASSSRSWAATRSAPVTPPAASATSPCSRSSAWRTSWR